MSAPTIPGEAPLLRVMGRRDLTALIINSVIGAGVFGLPAVVAGLTGAWSPPRRWTVNLFPVAKLAPLVLLIALGAIYFRSDVVATQSVTAPQWTDALLQMVFAFAGFEVALVAAGEVRRPKQDAAFALIAAIMIITAIYALVQLAVIGVLPNAAASKAPIADALGATLGAAGVTIGSLGAAVSAYGWLTGNALLIPRLPLSMAERGELPRLFARVHSAFRTPDVSIINCSLIALTLGLAGTFAATSTLSAIGRLVVYVVTCGGLVALRKRASTRAGFMLPGGPVFAAIGIVFCIWLLSTRNLAQGWAILAIVLAGAVVRAVTSAHVRSSKLAG